MNYSKLYASLIQRAKERTLLEGMYETHHIVPRSIGGTNKKSNLVKLTPREHYIAHWLLYKMSAGAARQKMAYAFFSMARNNPHQNRRITSAQYERAKVAMSQAAKKRRGNKTTEGQRWYHDPITDQEALFKAPDLAPNGWIKGRSKNYRRLVAASRKLPQAKFWNSEAAAAAARKGSSGTSWWYHPGTGEERRAVEQPGEGFIKGSRKWYTNGKANRQFVEGREPVGWVSGRSMDWKRNSPRTI